MGDFSGSFSCPFLGIGRHRQGGLSIVRRSKNRSGSTALPGQHLQLFTMRPSPRSLSGPGSVKHWFGQLQRQSDIVLWLFCCIYKFEPRLSSRHPTTSVTNNSSCLQHPRPGSLSFSTVCTQAARLSLDRLPLLLYCGIDGTKIGTRHRPRIIHHVLGRQVRYVGEDR